ncbi:MAG TPA: NAD-dependent succinate-semialdehyde dehydrogenase [Victivallales bacterium]|nr:NAD-dependent succinate-semialdehyde dehydrogenase [Victivallales bacterium]
MSITTLNPYTEEVINTYDEFTFEKVNNIIINAHHAFLSWKFRPVSERIKLVGKLSYLLVEKQDELAEIMTTEMGKPITVSRGEVIKCANLCRFYMENGHDYTKTDHVKTNIPNSRIIYEPLGVILAIMPWNFPFWQVFRFAVPTLIAGNTALLKHSPNTTGCSLAIEKLFIEAGFPVGTFSSLIIDIDKVPGIIESPFVKGVTLTGSNRAGKAVGAKAGEMIKKTVLELGGSDPYIILEDADLELAAKTCVKSRMLNSGQTCISAKRLIVVEKVAEAFEKQLIQEMKRIEFGDPMNPNEKYGPMARIDLKDNVLRQFEESVKMGAECIFKGDIPHGKGYFFPAAVLKNIKPGMPAYDEELFGPIATLLVVKDEEQAIEEANNTIFGLGAGIFTEDVEHGLEIASNRINAGTCVVNDLVMSMPELPFGGINQSGYGRELSFYGMREFVNIKTVYSK